MSKFILLFCLPRTRELKSLSVVIQKLCREALVWRQLKHPNVLSFIGLSYSVFPHDLLPCLLAPWMENGTLKDYINMIHYDPERDIPRLVRSHMLAYREIISQTDTKCSSKKLLLD
jgi:serine/threonine protein kinase